MGILFRPHTSLLTVIPVYWVSSVDCLCCRSLILWVCSVCVCVRVCVCVWGEGGYSSIGQSVTEAHPWSGCHSSSQWDSPMRVTLCVISSHSVQLCRLAEGTRAGGTTGTTQRKNVSGITRESAENCVCMCVSSICSGQCEYLSVLCVLVQSCPVTAVPLW